MDCDCQAGVNWGRIRVEKDVTSVLSRVRCIVRLPWNAVPETKPPAEQTMNGVHGLAVHERAAPDDGIDHLLSTGLERLGRHAASSERPMKPETANAAGRRFAHEVGTDGRMSGDDNAVHHSRDG